MRRAKRRTIAVLAAVALLSVASVIVIAAVKRGDWNPWRATQKLSTALHGAREVALLEYVEGVEITRKTATPEELSRLRRSLPQLPHPFERAGALCFIPHHEITVYGADGSTMSFAICFSCDNLMVSDGTGRESGYLYSSLPPSLRIPLASFFTSVGMPPKTEEEYAAILARVQDGEAGARSPE